MKLGKLIKNVTVKEIVGGVHTEIKSLCLNSLLCDSGSLFFAVNGNNDNGNKYIEDAKLKGAVAVVSEERSSVNITQIIVEDVKDAINKIVYNFYGFDKINVKFIGVVGTNGKTTTSYIIKSILEKDNKTVGVIGTSGIIYKNKYIAPELTTPDTLTLAETVSDMYFLGVEYVVMEVSAHAIAQKRCNFIKFDALVFTNCTEDHLDYFKSMEEYAKVKKSIFNKENCGFAVVNIDDKLGFKIAKDTNVNCYTYGLNSPTDVFSIDVKSVDDGVVFDMNLFDEILPLKFKFLGVFNVYNCMAAATLLYKLNISLDAIKNGIENISGLSGRMEYIESFKGAKIYVDYAHTPDGLENALKELKKVTDKKLIVLFGCGGNREKEKRAKMGIIAGKYADFSIITSDNPRYEEPYSIISEIEKGIRTKSLNYITIQNRYMATGYALEMLKKGDTLLLAGKGAEEYQEIMGVKTKYNDKETVKDIISKIELSGELI